MEFKISSGLKDNIGKELITDDNVAILELIKNSYDAGAKTVKVIFQNINHEYDSKICIVDDGGGMSKKGIETKWLFVGYSEKKNFDNLKSKRKMAGQKGIGRFSCDRLGKKLKIITKSPTDKEFNVLKLDWEKFEKDQKEEFQSIPVEVTNQKLADEKLNFIKFSGTLVEISDIRRDWDYAKLLKLKHYVQRLINPLQMDSKDKFKIILEAKDFLFKDREKRDDYNKVNGKVVNKVYEKIGMKSTTIDCEISENKKEINTSLNDKGIDIFELKEANKDFPLLGEIKVKISYLNRNARTVFSKVMGIKATDYGNILIFKNGFRILPYGERDDDWLRLNDRKAQGYNRYLGTRELFGRVEITGDQKEFREVTSRSEGMVETDSMKQLHKFIMFILKRLEKYVVGAIDWDSERENDPARERKDFENVKKDTLKIIKQIAGGSLENSKLEYNEDFLKIVEKKTIEKIPKTIKNLENISKSEKDKEIRELYLQQIRNLKSGLKLQGESQKEKLDEKEKKIKEIKSELEVKEKERLFLSGTLSIDQEATQRLIHIINNSTDPIKKALSEINKRIQKKSSIEKIIPFVDDISLEHEQIKYLSEILSIANFNTKVETIKKDIVQYIFEYLRNMKYSSLKFNFKNENIKFNCRFKPLEILIILNNFISNSLKQDATILRFDFEKDKDSLILRVSDNSDKGGVKDKDAPYIFNRAYSTTKGSGRGLYDVKRILKNLNGNIKFIGNNIENQLNGACLEIKIKK